MVKIVRNENDLKIGIEIIDEKSKELFNHDSKIKKILKVVFGQKDLFI